MPQSWVAPQQQNSLMDMFSQAEAFKAQRAQNALYAAKAAELPYERERAEALNAANIGKAEAQARKAESDTQGSGLDNALKKVQIGSQILSGVRDEGSYQWARKRATVEQLGTEDWPPNFDPAWVQQTQQKGMQIKDQIAAQMEEQKFAEQQKQSGIDNQFQQGNLDVARTNASTSQANAAETRRYHGVMENRPQAGFSMTTNPDGTASFSYGTPAKNELEKKVINEEDALARLAEIEKSANSQNLTYYNQAKNAVLDVHSKLGGEMTPDQAAFRDSMTDTRQATLTNLNKTIHELSGTAMGVKEADRIMATMPNMDDAPDVYDRKLQNTVRLTREAIARHKGALGQSGTQPGAASVMPPSPNLPKIEAKPQAEFDAMPMPGEYTGRRIKTPDGGVYRSNGSQWMRE